MDKIIYSVVINYPEGPRFRIKAPHKRGFPSKIMLDKADLVLDLTNKIVLKDINYRQFHRVSDEEVSLHSEYPLVCLTCLKVDSKEACYKCTGEIKNEE